MKQKRRNLKLLLNAEPFGFGPTAAIASFFPFLREQFSYIGYLGKNHTLDLQKSLQYDDICDYSGLSHDGELAAIKSVISEYDIVFTALDFGIAEIAKSMGKRVIIYDPLTWYWRDIPAIVAKSDLYIAQNFIGVEERITVNHDLFPTTKIISPIISRHQRTTKKYVLINLGGLQNPFWSIDDAAQYAKAAIDSLKKVIPSDENLIITTSSFIAKLLHDPSIQSLNRDAMCKVLSQTKYAFMTPGLGNIYDVAAFDIPTVWLPAANDSQGQQLELLRERRMCDASIDWKDIDGISIDYFGSQQYVLKQITKSVQNLSNNADSLEQYSSACQNAYTNIALKTYSSSSLLLDIYGSGGEKQISQIISSILEKICV